MQVAWRGSRLAALLDTALPIERTSLCAEGNQFGLGMRRRCIGMEAKLSVEVMARETSVPQTNSGSPQNVLEELLTYELFAVAERVRWQYEEIPWSTVNRSLVQPSLTALVRQIARAELTTYAATRRFLQEFADDIDFTQWMSVWFYEETKHPQALIRWLREVGECFSGAEMVRGRITAPFMKSRFGMLVTNVISEVHASATYVALARTTEEPVLKQVALNLAGDEARHATGFLTYARRALERSKSPEQDGLEALKVLHMWLNENAHVQHPVNTVSLRTDAGEGLLGGLGTQGADESPEERHSRIQRKIARKRALRLVGNLLGLELKSPADVVERIRTSTRTRASSPAPEPKKLSAVEQEP